jgi:lysophospholipase L1-like esterase
MASVGDSITRAFDATARGCLYSDCPANSWSTGTSTSVSSHYRQLIAKGAAISGRNYNYARTGAKVDELAGQMTKAVNAQYVTVLIGGNDLCTPTVAGMTSVADFQSRFRAGLAAYFATKSAGGLVFVSSIPDLDKLRVLGQTIPGAVRTWSTLGICQSMLSTKASATDLDTVRTREADFNRVLQQECAVYVSRCLFDGGATFTTSLGRAEISTLDYFHPSVAGQNKLAQVTWAAGWWRPGA